MRCPLSLPRDAWIWHFASIAVHPAASFFENSSFSVALHPWRRWYGPRCTSDPRQSSWTQSSWRQEQHVSRPDVGSPTGILGESGDSGQRRDFLAVLEDEGEKIAALPAIAA